MYGDWFSGFVKTNDDNAWRLYQARARVLTTAIKGWWFPAYDPNKYQLDHRYSLRRGFQDGVPLAVICGRHNLELLPKYRNLAKGVGCSITHAELLAGYVPNDDVSELAAMLEGVDDLATLLDWGKQVHRMMAA
jgi:hypothetical protein